MNHKHNGFVLLDILAALFILGLGLTVLLGLTQHTVMSYSKAANYFGAVNVASTEMEQAISAIKADPDQRFHFMTTDDNRLSGIYNIKVNAQSKSASLLIVSVQVSWQELSENRSYVLESLCYYD